MVRTARRRCLLVAIGVLLAACGPIGITAPATAPVSASPTTTAIPPTQATAGAQGIFSATPIIAATRPATRAATTSGATPATPAIGCDNAAVTDVVARFLDAYNAGDGARLLAFFPASDATRGLRISGEETYFQRYWDVRQPRGRDGTGFEAYARDELPPYWALRHAQHERLQLLRVDGGAANSFGLVDFGFLLTRQAEDLPTHAVYGKASIDCARGAFVVWSMGPQEQPAATPTRP